MRQILLYLFLSVAAVVCADDYPVTAGKDAVHTHASRVLMGIVLESPLYGNQTMAVTQSTNKLLYQDLLSESFVAKAGETLVPSFKWWGGWMSGYVYIDYNNDGRFETALDDDGRPSEGSEVVTYSYYNGKNSNGESLASGNVLNPPAFVLPEGLVPGVYRMRYKVDWDYIGAEGSDVVNNDIIRNGGCIVDTRLVVRPEKVGVKICVGGSEEVSKNFEADFGQEQTFEVGTLVGENKMLSRVIVKHGFNLDGDRLVHGTPQYVVDTLSFLSVVDDVLTLTSSMVDGDVEIVLETVDKDNPGDADINNKPQDAALVEGLNFKSLRFGATSIKTLSAKVAEAAYQDFTENVSIPIVVGNTVTLAVSATLETESGTETLSADEGILCIDYNHDGVFITALESVGNVSSFALPDELRPGFYRGRLYFSNIGVMADFNILVHKPVVRLELETPNGRVVGQSLYDASATRVSGKGIPTEVSALKQMTFVAQPLAKGYRAYSAEVTISRPDGSEGKFRVNLNGATTSFSIPADSVYGDIKILAEFTPETVADNLRSPVLIEEFDGESLNDDLWVTSTRYSAAWNRFIVDDPRVAFVDNGHLVCRCFANPGDIAGFDGQMISGAKQTSGRFAFNHGYVEARILTVPHSGNFPAFWLMPEDQSDGWPTCGEIDVWETINTESRAYHTVHSHWTYDLAHGGNGGNESCGHQEQWHTYGLLKEADRLTWYLDGTQVFTYSKSTSDTELQQGQWPFDKPFYIILNQSVGNGSWAAVPDRSFVYETRFDWVRVYQTREEAEDDGNVLLGVETDHNYVTTQSEETDTTIYDLNGQKVTSPRRGNFYIYKGRVRMWR